MPTGFKILDGNRIIDMEDMLVKRDQISEGNLWIVGVGDSGQLGNEVLQNKSSPVQTSLKLSNWKLSAVGDLTSYGIDSDGKLWSWGWNNYGQTGDGTKLSKSSPVQIGNNTWRDVSGGTVGAGGIQTDGTLWMWGWNNNGQLGILTDLTDKSSPVQTSLGGNDWLSLSIGSDRCAAIKTDGSLWAWGRNEYGQLGDNSTTNKSSPIQITAASAGMWKQVIADEYHSIGVKNDGSIWSWGYNTGRLGTNSTDNKSTPVQVGTNYNWKYVAAGLDHTGAIKNDGTLWVWGSNTYGQLGTNHPSSAVFSSPIQLGTDTSWKQIHFAWYHSVGLKTDGTIWGWGWNNIGQLGINSIDSYNYPVQMVSNNYNWKSIETSRYLTTMISDLTL